MTPVRPPFLPAAGPAQAPPRNDARTAAQRAFFEAALGKAAPPAPAPQAPQAQTAAPRVQAVASPEEPPRRIPRPGSIIDIKV